MEMVLEALFAIGAVAAEDIRGAVMQEDQVVLAEIGVNTAVCGEDPLEAHCVFGDCGRRRAEIWGGSTASKTRGTVVAVLSPFQMKKPS